MNNSISFFQMVFDKINHPKTEKTIPLLDILLKVGNARSGNRGHAGRFGQVGGSMTGKRGKGGIGVWREVKVTEKQVRVKNKKGIPVIDPKTGKQKIKTVYKFTQMNGKPLPKYMDGYSWRPNMVEKYWLEVKNPKDLENIKVLGSGLVLGVEKNKVQCAMFRNPDGTKGSKTVKNFKKCHVLDRDFEKVNDMNERNRKSKNKDVRETADLAKLIMASGIRVGGQEEKNAASRSTTSRKIGEEVFGASTLLGKHVVIEKGSVFLRFPAKSGERYNYEITNKEVEKMILDRAKKAGTNGNLFDQNAVGNQRALTYMKTLHPVKPTNKVFRDVVANRIARKKIESMLKTMPKPPNLTQKEFNKACLEVGKTVGAVLGHEVSVPIYKTVFDKVKGKTVFVKVMNKETKKLEKVKTGKFEIKVNPTTSVKSYIDPLEFKVFGDFTFGEK